MPLPGRIDHERTNGTAHLHYFDISTTNTNGVVTQVTHASVHVVASGDCFDPETCCDERERALIAAMRAYLRPEHAPQMSDRAVAQATLDHCCASNWRECCGVSMRQSRHRSL